MYNRHQLTNNVYRACSYASSKYPSFQLFEIVQSVQHDLFGGFLYLPSEEDFVEDGVYLWTVSRARCPALMGHTL